MIAAVSSFRGGPSNRRVDLMARGALLLLLGDVEPIGLLTGVPGLCLSESRRPGRRPTSVGAGADVLSCLVLSRGPPLRRAAPIVRVMSCPVLSCPVLSCPVQISIELSCPGARRFVLSKSWHETYRIVMFCRGRHLDHVPGRLLGSKDSCSSQRLRHPALGAPSLPWAWALRLRQTRGDACERSALEPSPPFEQP